MYILEITLHSQKKGTKISSFRSFVRFFSEKIQTEKLIFFFRKSTIYYKITILIFQKS